LQVKAHGDRFGVCLPPEPHNLTKIKHLNALCNVLSYFFINKRCVAAQ